MNSANTWRLLAAGVLAGGLAACGGSSTPSPTQYPAPNPNAYRNVFTVSVPSVPPCCTSFDIIFYDPNASQVYLADRITDGVDVFNSSTLSYVGTAGAGSFTGKGLGPPPAPQIGGPNGLVPVGGGIVFAGDGNSTLKVVNVNTMSLVYTSPTTSSGYAGPALPSCGNPTSGGGSPPPLGTGNGRLDEMGYDPVDHIVLAINPDSCPAFGNFFSSLPPYNLIAVVQFLNANGGVEQPTYDPAQKKFLVPIPTSLANPGGEVDVVDPLAHTITNVFPLPAADNCQPNGTALGLNENLFLGCSVGDLLTINATTGAVVNTVANHVGADEVWYNPVANRFYAACISDVNGPDVVVTDGNGNFLTSFATGSPAHVVAVDQTSDKPWVPWAPPSGGMVVFGH